MNKPKISNIFLTALIAFAVSMFAGFLAHMMITGSPFFQQDSQNQPLPITNILNEPVIPVDAAFPNFSEFEPEDYYTPVLSEFFIIRENNGRIGVFHSENGNEYFLYNIHRPINLLPQSDQELIRQGIILYTHEELTMFKEDFGS